MTIPAPQIDVLSEDPRWAQTGFDGPAWARRAHAAAAIRAPALRGLVSVLLADDGRLHDLNRTFRGVDKPTNVLSFPADARMRDDEGFLGDVALGFETCLAEAAAAAKPLSEHAAHLIVHGLLHLVGFDHETDEDASAMEELESLILADLGVADPYARTAVPQKLRDSASNSDFETS